MRKVRWFSKCLCLLLVLSVVFAGCGKEEKSSEQSSFSKEEESKETSKEVTSSTEKKEEIEPYTVTWWLPGDESADNEKVMKKVNERLAELLPNTELEIVWVGGSEMRDRWSKAMATGEKVDLVWSCNWSSQGVHPLRAVEQEAVLPITDLLEEYGQEMVEAIGGEKVIELHRYSDGEVYFFPSYQGLTTGRVCALMREDVVNLMPAGWLEKSQEKLFEHSGYSAEDINVRFDIMEEYLKVAKENNMMGLGLDTNSFEGQMLSVIGLEATVGHYKIVKNGDVYTAYNGALDEVYRAYCERMKKWFDMGYIREDIATAEIVSTDDYCLKVTNANDSDWLEKVKVARKAEGYSWETTGLLFTENTKVTSGYSTGHLICYTSENPERTMQVLNLINTDAELYNLIVFGIEGEHYIKNADGTITRPIKDDRTYAGIDNWRVGNCVNSLMEAGMDIDTYKKKLELDKNGEINTLANFTADASSYSVEAGNLNAVMAEYGQWLTLAKDDFDYSLLEKKLKEAGWDVMEKSLIGQLEEYLKSRNLGTLVLAE